MPQLTATCHTDGCHNINLPITMDYLDDPPEMKPSVVFCGVCGQEITDVEW